jgi:hypothetical protein
VAVTFTPQVLSKAADRLAAGPDLSWTDPAHWARVNMSGWNPAWYQEDILRLVAKERKVSVIGPHGIGKTSIDAVLVFWFAFTREAAGIDWKVVTTAGAWRQLQRYLWPEIHKWSKRLRSPLLRNVLLTIELKLRYGQAFAVASDDPANIEGAHADEILYIIDEAKNVPPAFWDAIEGAMATGAAYCLANSTPGKAEGRLYEIHAKRPGYEDWTTLHITLEDAVKAGRIRPEWAEARARQWGKTSPVYINRVLGEFSTTDSDGVIPLEWLEVANELWQDLAEAHRLEASPLSVVSADVATEEGVDKTIITTRHGNVLSRIIVLPEADTMKTTGKVKELIDTVGPVAKKKQPIAVIDAIGVGTGVVDRLREQGVKVDAFQSAGKAARKDKTGELTFLNRRAEAWWCLRDLLNPAFGVEVAIPDDPVLIGDLVAPKWDQTSTGHIKIEDKDEVRKRLGRSPDEGDAVVMNFNARIDRSTNLMDAMPVGLDKASVWRKGVTANA